MDTNKLLNFQYDTNDKGKYINYHAKHQMDNLSPNIIILTRIIMSCDLIFLNNGKKASMSGIWYNF